MAWEDLAEDIADLFGNAVAEVALYEDRRNQRTMHVVRVSKAQARTARRAAVCAAAQNRWRRRDSRIRRGAEFAALGRVTCSVPGCCNLLTPPWCLRSGRVPATCGRDHSRRFAELKRQRKAGTAGGGVAGGTGAQE
jgi:hypothetical protein